MHAFELLINGGGATILRFYFSSYLSLDGDWFKSSLYLQSLKSWESNNKLVTVLIDILVKIFCT